MTDWAAQFSQLARQHGEPLATTELRRHNSDFKVFEIPPCLPEGEGEHLWLHIRKDGCNTDWVAEQLARLAGVHPKMVSYAGRKDRHAVCEQWFSVHLPGKSDIVIESDSDAFQVLSQARHTRKLKTGALKGNRFEITLRPTSTETLPIVEIEARLKQIEAKGVPNYFGEQRFGRDMSNLRQVERWNEGYPLPRSRNRRSMTISAARSWIFNCLLDARLRKKCTDQLVKGDYCKVVGRHSGFEVETLSDDLIRQQKNREIELALPLAGSGLSCHYLAEFSGDSAESYIAQWCEKLINIQVSTDWRPAVLFVEEIQFVTNSDASLTLFFDLPPGAFATSVIREIVNVTDQSKG